MINITETNKDGKHLGMRTINVDEIENISIDRCVESGQALTKITLEIYTDEPEEQLIERIENDRGK